MVGACGHCRTGSLCEFSPSSYTYTHTHTHTKGGPASSLGRAGRPCGVVVKVEARKEAKTVRKVKGCPAHHSPSEHGRPQSRPPPPTPGSPQAAFPASSAAALPPFPASFLLAAAVPPSSSPDWLLGRPRALTGRAARPSSRDNSYEWPRPLVSPAPPPRLFRIHALSARGGGGAKGNGPR